MSRSALVLFLGLICLYNLKIDKERSGGLIVNVEHLFLSRIVVQVYNIYVRVVPISDLILQTS